MKFKINENKLEKIIFKYLEGKNFIIKETPENYYFIENEEDKYSQIRVRKNDMVCFIYYKLIEEIKLFFSIEAPTAKKGLTRYVENTLNIRVYNTFKDGLLGIKVVENTLN